jgi:cyclase
VRTLRPTENVYAFYDGRLDERPAPEGSTWVEDGALSLGVASYAIVDGEEALVYDTHVSVDRANSVRRTLEQQGVRRFTVLLSHWHLDHVAGTAAFAECEILAGARTHELLSSHREAIEQGTLEGPPAISPLILPTRQLAGPTRLTVGRLELELIPVEIHSDDATVVWIPEQRLLLAGDTMEDTITYVAEPDRLAAHLVDLERLRQLGPARILPNHGDAETIAAGGYTAELIDATETYVEALIEMRDRPELRGAELRDLLAGPLAAGSISYFPPYEAVHQANLKILGLAS